MTLSCCRPGSKAKLPRIITTGPVHYNFFLFFFFFSSGQWPQLAPSHTPYTHTDRSEQPARARSLSTAAARADGAKRLWMCKYGCLSKRTLMVCTPDCLKLPRGVFPSRLKLTSFFFFFLQLTPIFYVRKVVRNSCVKLLFIRCGAK